MPISKVGSTITQTPAQNFDQFLQTGVIRSDQFAVRDSVDQTKQITLDPSLIATNTTVSLQPQASSSGVFKLPGVAGGTLALESGDNALQYAAPTTGQTVTIAAGSDVLVIEPLGTLSALTVVLPTAPLDGTIVRMSSTQIVTTLTLSGGGSDTVVNATTAFAANGFSAFVYKASSTKWYRIG